jgi:hypothetical protein
MELDIPYRLLAMIVVIAVLIGYVVYQLYETPQYPREEEGFYGGVARGSGHPDCLRILPEASVLLDLLDSRKGKGGVGGLGGLGGVGGLLGVDSDAPADRAEFELLLSKLACLKKDLLSPSGIVEATRYQPFDTSHDRMAVGEFCGMCFQHTVASRDLDIVFGTWRDRGNVLLRKLCTEFGFSEQDVTRAEKAWLAIWTDVYDIATSRCLRSVTSPSSGPRDAVPFEPEHLKDARSYDYKYGGLSASGWNGAV